MFLDLKNKMKQLKIEQLETLGIFWAIRRRLLETSKSK